MGPRGRWVLGAGCSHQQVPWPCPVLLAAPGRRGMAILPAGRETAPLVLALGEGVHTGKRMSLNKKAPNDETAFCLPPSEFLSGLGS